MERPESDLRPFFSSEIVNRMSDVVAGGGRGLGGGEQGDAAGARHGAPLRCGASPAQTP